MKWSLYIVLLAILCFSVTYSGEAQNSARHTLELDALGKTTANLETGPYTSTGVSYSTLNGVHHEQFFGGVLAGYSYALTPRLALEARGGFLFGHQPTVVQSGGEQILVHAGLRGTYPLGHTRFAFIARIEPGIASFSNAYRSGSLTITQNPDGSTTFSITPNYTRLSHFSLQEGVGLSARLTSRTDLHVDLGHETLLEGDRHQGALGFPAGVEDHTLISAGISRSFGQAFSIPRLEPRTPSSSNEFILSYAIQPQIHLEARSFASDSGIAITGSHDLRRWLALDSSIVSLSGGDTPNYQDGGHETEFFAGVKLGLRRPRYGIFAKVRPGLAIFSKTYQTITASGPSYDVSSDFALDAGAVLEFYPAHHLVLRADLGEVFTRYGAVTVTVPNPQTTSALQQPTIDEASGQFLIGVGWRF